MSIYHVNVQNDDNFPVEASALERAAIQTLTRQNAPQDAEMSVVITSDEAVRDLNRQYRGIDSATDVLSFTADAPPRPDDEEGDDQENVYLGDLLIAFPYARAQAEREGHALADSFMLLVVHGTLHLLGYDHDTPENRAAMWAAQAEVLDALGISQAIVPALEADHHSDSDDY